MSIISRLSTTEGAEEAYLTPNELVRIVIPLAGEKAPIEKHANAIKLYRTGKLLLEGWPDCAPAANDKRIAREFLLFLSSYGFCRTEKSSINSEEKYFLSSIMPEEVAVLVKIPETKNISGTIRNIQSSQISATAERRRILVEVLLRPQQPKFRREVLKAFNNTCIITGVTITDVLEAAHIIPVREKGSDTIDNGLCLRADIHLLFDTGHLRIAPEGLLHLSEVSAATKNYKYLPTKITLPRFINFDNLAWRWKYH
jgi:hypothetical protein